MNLGWGWAKIKQDDNLQQEIAKERERWRQILVRIVYAAKFIAKHNLAFRGKMRNYIKITMVTFWAQWIWSRDARPY